MPKRNDQRARGRTISFLAPIRASDHSGFTLLEVIMTITIILTLTIAATTTIRNSIDLRQALAHQINVSHGINMVMQTIVNDLEQVYIISTKRQELNPGTRSTGSIFKRDNDGSLRMTTQSHRPKKFNAPESDQTLVVYELRDDRDHSGRKNLYRGESKVLPEDLKEDVPMVLLAEGVKKFEVIPWNGQKWDEGRWDTNRSDHRNMLPKMVRVHIEMLELDHELEEDRRNAEDIPTSRMTTVVHIPNAWGLKEYKPYSGSLKWN